MAKRKANKLESIRTNEGIKKTELAYESGLSVGTIQKTEKGNVPREETKVNIKDGINKIIKNQGKNYQYKVSDLFPK